MVKTGDKRGSSPLESPLNLASAKRSRFMIDRLLDEENGDEHYQIVNINEGSNNSGTSDRCNNSINKTKTIIKDNDMNLVNVDKADDEDDDGKELEAKIGIIPKTSPLAGNSPNLRDLDCRLEGRELWCKFYELSTEMIITKSGR